MSYILEMSTDADITNTQVSQGFPTPYNRYTWQAIVQGNLNIPDQAVIVVIAHGNNQLIGNQNDNNVALTPEAFLAMIAFNLANNAQPDSIYISTCGNDYAGFAAGVALAAQANQIWAGTRIYGHRDLVNGAVPGPNQIAWTTIYIAYA